jgi:tetratricopeptide (TPR) repeat protein
MFIAVVALLARWNHVTIPFWKAQSGFGPFPNRNHTGHVFALGGVLALGCAADVARRSRRQAVAWILGAAVLLVALVLNYSRGGLLVFVGALVFWAMLRAWQRQSWKALAVGGSIVLVVVAVVLVGGGAVAARFAGGADSQVGFRVLIWRDTLSLIHASPWCGAGLGNFRALFPFYRVASVIQQSVLHPESDWLWLASELGWLGVLLALGAAFFILRAAFPWPRGSQRQLRGALFAGAIAALVHTAMDVPGHRLGSALVLLLVMVLARGDAPVAPDVPLISGLCRLCGFMVFGGVVLFSFAERSESPADALLLAGNFARAEIAADRALSRAPLDWNAYFARAGARACEGKTLEAVADFRRARVLEPHYAGLPLEEGRFWLQTQPGLALVAWREALRRARPPLDGEVFGQMLGSATTTPLREQLLALAHDRPALQLAWFQAAPPEEARSHLQEISVAGQAWTPAQRAAFQRRVDEIVGASGKP